MSEKSDVSLVDPSDAELTPEDIRRAQLVACGQATDVDDARQLLDALGLLP